MRGRLLHKRAFTQLLLAISITLISFIVFGAFILTPLLSMVTGVDILAFSDPQKLDAGDPAVVTFMRGLMAIQFLCLCIIPVIICAKLFSLDSEKYLGLRKPSKLGYFIAAIALMMVAFPLVNWLGEINRSINFPDSWQTWMRAKEDDAAASIKIMLSQQSVKDLVLNIIFIALFAGIGEELLFRSLAQRLFIRIFRSPIIGIVISAFIFSAMHVQFYGFLPRFVLGICLGLIYWYSGSIYVAIAAHFLYDAVLIVLAYYNPEMLNEETVKMSVTDSTLAGIISLGLVIMVIGWMKLKSTNTYSNTYAEDDLAVKDHPF